MPLTLPAPAGWVELQVFDLLGQPVRRLAGGTLTPGHRLVPWDGRDEQGRVVASGVYLYRLQVDGWSASGKVTRGE
ncbi:MAG: FlgD immunoglobulin-like domain containing protein [Candidatus Latescibacterota bacterium]